MTLNQKFPLPHPVARAFAQAHPHFHLPTLPFASPPVSRAHFLSSPALLVLATAVAASIHLRHPSKQAQFEASVTLVPASHARGALLHLASP